MRKTLMLGAIMVMAVAGAVIAAGSAQGPASADLAQATPVVKSKAPIYQNEEGKQGKKPGFTTRPRLRIARDYPLASTGHMAWNAEGKMLAFQGYVKQLNKEDNLLQLDCDPLDASATREVLPLDAGTRFVGFTPDGTKLVTVRREYQLVSGFHQLQYLNLVPDKILHIQPGRPVELDADNTRGYSFAADGKTYRTLDTTHSDRVLVSKVRVTSVDAKTGRTLKTLMTAEGEIVGFVLSPRGERLAVLTTKGELTVYVVETGKPIWTKIAIKEQYGPYSGEIHLNFSANASRLFMDAQRKRPLVFNVESGELLPALENVPLITTLANCLSPDGRLLFLCGDHSRPPRNDRVSSVSDELGRFMSVWDTDSGKLLKQWANHIPSAAVFHPTKSILAILEPNGENTTRLGLWDFSAEVEKK